jgi:transcriptional regulator with XRE-family HTH domain
MKERRLQRRQTLRAFCEANNLDPANYSKLERGKLPPPRDPVKLAAYAEALGIEPHTPQWREFHRLASLSRGELPAGVLSDSQLVAKLPALFRTLEGDPVPEEVLDELIATIRQE